MDKMDRDQKESNPSRRKFLEISLLGMGGLSAGLFGLGSIGCDSRGTVNLKGSKPNILLIVADDAGWRDVGFHDSEIKTPAIDYLAETGVELNQFYVSPTCSPTRASLLTGKPASRFGILGPIAGKSRQVLPVDTPTLARLLRDSGYATAITGKWHLGLRPENGPHKYGFEYTYGYLHGQIDQYTHRYKFGDITWHRNNRFIEEKGHATDLITNEAIQFIKQYRDRKKPFFLYVPYSVPHIPLQEEENWLSIYKDTIQNESRRAFAASVTHMDHAINLLINTLEEENQRENTLVIFISDNGAQKDWMDVSDKYGGRHAPNDQLGDNRPLRDWKASLYEGGIRVPAIFNWPGTINPGRVIDLTSVNDIFPTLAWLAGIDTASQFDVEGINIWKAVQNNKSLGKRMLYWRTKNQFALRKGDWKLIVTGHTLEDGITELFNIKNDPYEKTNAAGDHPDIVKDMLEELKAQADLDQNL